MISVAQHPTEFGPSDALTCALALEPQSFSRNRYLENYDNPVLRGCHRRAKWLRSLAKDVYVALSDSQWEVTLSAGNPWTIVTYEGLPMAVRRTTQLTDMDMAVLNALLLQEAKRLMDPRFELTRQMADLLKNALADVIPSAERLNDQVCVELLRNRMRWLDDASAKKGAVQ